MDQVVDIATDGRHLSRHRAASWLNVGDTGLRAATARAVVAAGLHPTIGITIMLGETRLHSRTI